MNTSPEKLFLFYGKTFVEPFSHFFEIAEVLFCKRVSHWCKKVIVRCRQVKGLQRGGRMSHPSDFKVSFASFDVWDRALSCDKITLPCLLAHSGRFSINAWFKLIIVDDNVVLVWPAIHVFTLLSFTLKLPLLNCRNHVSHVLIDGACSPLWFYKQTTFHSFFLLIK